MKKLYTLFITILLIIPCRAQQTELSLKLEVGKNYRQIMIAKATADQEINGQPLHMVMIIKGGMSYLVKALNTTGYDMEVVYDSLSIEMQLPQVTMTFSSEKNDADDIFSSVLAEMRNKPFYLKMTKSGKIEEVKNIDAVFDAVFLKFPQLPEDKAAQIKSQLLKAYGEEAFRGNIEMLTAVFPEKSVALGETWVINTKLESGMSADMVSTYKLVKGNSTYNQIHGESVIKTVDKDAYIEVNGMPTKYDLTGTMVSEIKVDKNTGWIVMAEIHQEIKGDVYIRANPQMADGLKIPIIMINEMTVADK